MIRLSPSDWPDGQRCEIEVDIDFVHTVFDEVGGEFVPAETHYRIIRKVAETPAGEKSFSREPEVVELFELTDSGAEPVLGPEIRIGEMLPREMKNVFFTDGDKVMNFISPQLTKQTKQHQLREAIRSLLGLRVLEMARDHIDKARRRFDKQVAKGSGSAEVEATYEQLEKERQQWQEHTTRVASLESQIQNLQNLDTEKDRKIVKALKDSDDPTELGRRLEETKRDLQAAETTVSGLKKLHQDLLASQELSWGLMGSLLRSGVDHLSALADKGVIPSASLPVLQDRLELQKCICGEDLSEGTAARANVESLMATQKAVDAENEALTALYHRAKVSLQEHESAVAGGKSWIQRYEAISKQRLSQHKVVEGLQRQEKSLGIKINALDEEAINHLTADRDTIRADKSNKEDERSEEEIKRRECERRIKDLEPKYEKLKKASKKQDNLQRRITVTQDLLGVVTNTLGRLQTEYLTKVSNRMNELFLRMVGADPQVAGGVFKRVEITPNYHIRVLSMEDRMLDPDHELNGASKRALTIAFIWALTEVSGVTAPRVIDTPLGMMSGGVKRRVVEIVSNPLGDSDGAPGGDSRGELQVVLFLTRQEILKVEDFIDKRAGVVFTYTNTSFYPTDVVNDPGVDQPTILLCRCNHRQKCSTCAQKDDDQYDLSLRSD